MTQRLRALFSFFQDAVNGRPTYYAEASVKHYGKDILTGVNMMRSTCAGHQAEVGNAHHCLGRQ